MPNKFYYQLEFAAEALDESALRENLERLGAQSIAITRSAGPQPQSVIISSDIEEKLYRMFVPGQGARRKHLLALVGNEAEKKATSLALKALVHKGVIKRVRHGVFALADDTPETAISIPPMNETPSGETTAKIMELLKSPMSAVELREHTGLTRQRVEQILSKMINRGDVVRNEVFGERGQHVYIRADVSRQAILLRPPSLTDARVRTLSSMSAETVHRASEVSAISGINVASTVNYLRQLEAQGMVGVFKLGGHVFCALTPRGLGHPQYEIGAAKAAPADVWSDFGNRRGLFLQVLSVLGEARTRDITYASPEGLFEEVGYGPGNLMQRLTIDGLVERTVIHKANPVHRAAFDQIIDPGAGLGDRGQQGGAGLESPVRSR